MINRWLDRELTITNDVWLMVTLALISLGIMGFTDPDDLNGVVEWVVHIFLVVFIILFVRMWAKLIYDHFHDDKPVEEIRPPVVLCNASTQRGGKFIKCTFPRTHPPGDHSWTVDI